MARRTPKSNKLGRTLGELESAFADWENITTDIKATDSANSQKLSEKELELKKKTRKLLEELRDQLRQLGE